ncbi:hypothetical protein LMG9964_06547 [Paraburkholderia phenoliruptrix]|uniref:Uncharacterized protein n=1 Tax=Paraburkholderia phenoliruptrix TaxID=252970 RepID=A0A6J5KFS0_9BURK|nr:hypothetical protein LMG9964_06547 [Paraburkholderia phenoliruptrix]
MLADQSDFPRLKSAAEAANRHQLTVSRYWNQVIKLITMMIT